MPWIVIASIVGLYAGALLLQFNMNWLGIGPMLVHLIAVTILALALSKNFIKRNTRKRSLFDFRAIVVTISLLFCMIGSNFLSQLTQKHLFGRVWVSDTSKEAYEEQHGKTDEILGNQLSEKQAAAFSMVRRVTHEIIKVLSEEIVFRWIILGTMLTLLPPAWAIILSSLIFAGMHIVLPIAVSDPQLGLTRLPTTFAIGAFCGIAYLWHGLPAAFLIHFLGNLIRVLAFGEYDFIIDWILWGSAFCTIFLLTPTLWFTRRRATPA